MTRLEYVESLFLKYLTPELEAELQDDEDPPANDTKDPEEAA